MEERENLNEHRVIKAVVLLSVTIGSAFHCKLIENTKLLEKILRLRTMQQLPVSQKLEVVTPLLKSPTFQYCLTALQPEITSLQKCCRAFSFVLSRFTWKTRPVQVVLRMVTVELIRPSNFLTYVL